MLLLVDELFIRMMLIEETHFEQHQDGQPLVVGVLAFLEPLFDLFELCHVERQPVVLSYFIPEEGLDESLELEVGVG